jgi:hypothetical protein
MVFAASAARSLKSLGVFVSACRGEEGRLGLRMDDVRGLTGGACWRDLRSAEC